MEERRSWGERLALFYSALTLFRTPFVPITFVLTVRALVMFVLTRCAVTSSVLTTYIKAAFIVTN